MTDFVVKTIPGSSDFSIEPIAAAPRHVAVEVPMHDYFREQLGLTQPAQPASAQPPVSAKPVSDTARAIHASFRDAFQPSHSVTGRFKL